MSYGILCRAHFVSWKSIPDSSVKLLQMIKANDDWRRVLFPPPGRRVGNQSYTLRDVHIAFCAEHCELWLLDMQTKGFVRRVGRKWEATEKWEPVQVMTNPTVGHLTR